MLCLLILDNTDNWEFFCYKYKVPNKIKDKFKYISKNLEALKSKKFYLEDNLKKIIYLTNKEMVKNILLFGKCESNKTKHINLEKLLDYINFCKIPKFPISGDDLKKLGYVSGRDLGKKLKFLEEKWIENNFTLKQEYIEKYLNKNKRN